MFAGDDFEMSARASSTLGKAADSVRSDTALNRYHRSARPAPPRRRCGHSGEGDQQDRPTHAIGRGVDGSDRSEERLDLIREPIMNSVSVIFSRRGEVRRIDRTEFQLDTLGLRRIAEAIRKGLNRGLSRVTAEAISPSEI